LTAEHPRRDTLAFRRARRERRAATRARLLSVARALRMSPADATDAHLHENALAEDLTGASLLRTRNVENTEKRVSNAEMRSETPSAAAIPRSAPDAREPPPPSAKHALTRRPGAILRAAERLVLAAAVEDAAAGDAVEGDGSHTQPPGGGSDDTRQEARFHAPDVFDFLFERERETFGETQELARVPAAKWWTSMVDPRLPEASDANADLGLGNPRTCFGAPKERETFPPREAPPRAEAKAKAKKKKSVVAAAAADEGVDTSDADSGLALSFARLRVATDGAKARARAARERLARNLSQCGVDSTTTDEETARFFAALPGLGVCVSLAEGAFATRLDARAAEAHAALETRQRAYRASSRDSPAGGSPRDGRHVSRSFDTETSGRDVPKGSVHDTEASPVGNALFKFNAQSRRTQPLRDFLIEHFDHPYPSDAQRERLARESGMTRAQVGNWFINARVRIWRPMIVQLGLQIEDERRNAKEPAARKGGQKPKRPTNREQARRARKEGARGDETAATRP